jgi:hypothetical protein
VELSAAQHWLGELFYLMVYAGRVPMLFLGVHSPGQRAWLIVESGARQGRFRDDNSPAGWDVKYTECRLTHNDHRKSLFIGFWAFDCRAGTDMQDYRGQMLVFHTKAGPARSRGTISRWILPSSIALGTRDRAAVESLCEFELSRYTRRRYREKLLW